MKTSMLHPAWLVFFIHAIAGPVLAKADAAITSVVRAANSPRWVRHTIDNTSRGADGVKLGDINADGRADIVTGWEEGGEVRVYIHPGAEQVRNAWPRVTAGRVRNVEEAIFADLDGDGQLEVISGTEGQTRTLYWHRPAAPPNALLDEAAWRTDPFPAAAGNQMWMQATAVQLDDQHGLDLLVASKGPGGSVSWLQAPAAPHDLDGWRLRKLRDAGWIMSLLPLDVDGDSDLDVVITDRKGTRAGTWWLENPGPVANRDGVHWPEHAVGAAGREVMFADTGDVDGDGLTDLAVATKPADVVLFQRASDGSWQEQAVRLDDRELGDAKGIKIGDLDHDGLADLVFTCENATKTREGVVWLQQQPGRTWQQHSLGGSEGVKFDLVQLLDIDGDGDLDVVTCEERDELGVVWYENPHRWEKGLRTPAPGRPK